jgi:hypothetical protein
MYIIKDYERLKEELKYIFCESSNYFNEIKNINKNNKFTIITPRISIINSYISSVNAAINYFETQYLNRIENYFDALKAFHNYEYFSIATAKETSDECTSKSTWNRYRCKFSFIVAKNLNLI